MTGLSSVYAHAGIFAWELDARINSRYNELSPVISADGKMLFFCREGDPRNVGYKQRKHDQDIWVSKRDSNGKFGPPEHLEAPFNSAGFDFPVAYFDETQTLYVGNVYAPDGSSSPGLSKSRFIDGSFSAPEPLTIEDFYNDVNLTGYSVGADEKTLLLSLQRKDSRGKSDLYVSFLKADGKWSAPVNLGGDINSTDAEISPYLAEDMRTLYFASNRPGSTGRFDLYVARREGDSFTAWSKPLNLGPAINKEGSNISLTVLPGGNEAIYSRETRTGGKDLQVIYLPEKFRPLRLVSVSGNVTDFSGNPLEATVVAEQLGTGKILERTASILPSGKFSIKLRAGLNYGLHAEKSNYAPISQNINLAKNSPGPARNVHLTLIRLETGSKIRLNNVFFASNSAKLSRSSGSELDRLVILMQANPNMKIEIGGHTDNVGSPEANRRLSGRRARAVMQYLLDHKIARSRISARGYGSSRPAASNGTEKGRRQNRRVEFSITEL